MSEADTQTVDTATEAQAQPAAEAAVAQDTTSSLDDLISEFDAQTKPQPAPVAASNNQPPPEWLQAKSEIDAWRAERAAERERADFADAIKGVKGDFDVPDFAVRGWLSHVAEQNPKVHEIWQNRLNNPGAAKKLIASLKNDFAKDGVKKIKGVDPVATADREAVAAAVKGTSTKAPEPASPKYGDMNAAEFEKVKRDLGL